MKSNLVIFALLLFSCNNENREDMAEKNSSPTAADSLTVKKSSETKKAEEEPLVADTGQTWFKVSVTRNDTSYIKYEGNWPVLLTTDGFATLAFTAAKGALVISHGLTFYMNGWPYAIGRIPIMPNASKKGETSMILMPVVNGAYHLAVSPDNGFLEIIKSDGKTFSGYFEAHATNENKDKFHIKGQFLNIKPHGS